MTKAELIAALAPFPDDALVFVSSDGGIVEVVRQVGWLSPLDHPDVPHPLIGIYLDPHEEGQSHESA